MSDTALPSIDLREQLARIDRLIAGTQQLMPEESKLRGDRAMAPWQVVTAAMAVGAAPLGAGVALVRLL